MRAIRFISFMLTIGAVLLVTLLAIVRVNAQSSDGEDDGDAQRKIIILIDNSRGIAIVGKDGSMSPRPDHATELTRFLIRYLQAVAPDSAEVGVAIFAKDPITTTALVPLTPVKEWGDNEFQRVNSLACKDFAGPDDPCYGTYLIPTLEWTEEQLTGCEITNRSNPKSCDLILFSDGQYQNPIRGDLAENIKPVLENIATYANITPILAGNKINRQLWDKWQEMGIVSQPISGDAALEAGGEPLLGLYRQILQTLDLDNPDFHYLWITETTTIPVLPLWTPNIDEVIVDIIKSPDVTADFSLPPEFVGQPNIWRQPPRDNQLKMTLDGYGPLGYRVRTREQDLSAVLEVAPPTLDAGEPFHIIAKLDAGARPIEPRWIDGVKVDVMGAGGYTDSFTLTHNAPIGLWEAHHWFEFGGPYTATLNVSVDDDWRPAPVFTSKPFPFTVNEPPTATPAPTETPADTPVPTNTPADTPAPTATPTDTPVPTSTPTDTPAPTATPADTPIPTNTPTDTPAPTATPTDTPVPTSTPTVIAPTVIESTPPVALTTMLTKTSTISVTVTGFRKLYLLVVISALQPSPRPQLWLLKQHDEELIPIEMDDSRRFHAQITRPIWEDQIVQARVIMDQKELKDSMRIRAWSVLLFLLFMGLFMGTLMIVLLGVLITRFVRQRSEKNLLSKAIKDGDRKALHDLIPPGDIYKDPPKREKLADGLCEKLLKGAKTSRSFPDITAEVPFYHSLVEESRENDRALVILVEALCRYYPTSKKSAISLIYHPDHYGLFVERGKVVGETLEMLGKRENLHDSHMITFWQELNALHTTLREIDAGTLPSGLILTKRNGTETSEKLKPLGGLLNKYIDTINKLPADTKQRESKMLEKYVTLYKEFSEMAENATRGSILVQQGWTSEKMTSAHPVLFKGIHHLFSELEGQRSTDILADRSCQTNIVALVHQLPPSVEKTIIEMIVLDTWLII